MSRTRKGQVAIENRDGWIRLRWRYQGKRKTLSLGLAHNEINLSVAKQRAIQIEMDMLSGNFDSTLKKYKSESVKSQENGAVDLFNKFIEYKARRVQPRTLEKYRGLVVWLKDFSGDHPITDEHEASEFIDWLLDNMEPVTAKERLGLLNAAWNWGIKQELITTNPWDDLNVNTPPKRKVKAFTKEEVNAIIQGFQLSIHYNHYTDYVKFKFNTGCRTGEANGLKWNHLNDDCTIVWFGESHTHGQQKEVKGGRDREIKLHTTLSQLLQQRKVDKAGKADDLVFPAPRGGAINEGNFGKRAWKQVLEGAGVPYQRPYNTRHTFISHALEAAMNPVEVAFITGHNVRTLYQKYAGLIKSYPTTPDLWS